MYIYIYINDRSSPLGPTGVFLIQAKRPTSPKNGVSECIRHNKEQSLDPTISFLALPGAPGSANGPPSCQILGTMPATSLVTKKTRFVSQMTVIDIRAWQISP